MQCVEAYARMLLSTVNFILITIWSKEVFPICIILMKFVSFQLFFRQIMHKRPIVQIAYKRNCFWYNFLNTVTFDTKNNEGQLEF